MSEEKNCINCLYHNKNGLHNKYCFNCSGEPAFTMWEDKEKKYSGYGYHGGGRPRKDVEARRVTISISGTPSEIAELKNRAAAAGLNVSRYVLDNLTK